MQSKLKTVIEFHVPHKENLVHGTNINVDCLFVSSFVQWSFICHVKLHHDDDDDDDKLEMTKKKLLWLISRYYSSNCLEELRKTIKMSVKIINLQAMIQTSKHGATELTSESWCLVKKNGFNVEKHYTFTIAVHHWMYVE